MEDVQPITKITNIIAMSCRADASADVSGQYLAGLDLKSSAEILKLKEVTDLAAAEKNGFTISSPTATGEIYMQVINAYLPDVDEETHKKIVEEVRAAERADDF